MDILEFDDILRMEWLTAHKVVIDCDCRWVTTYTQDVIVLHFIVDSIIELHPSVLPISLTLHRMAPIELQELKI